MDPNDHYVTDQKRVQRACSPYGRRRPLIVTARVAWILITACALAAASCSSSTPTDATQTTIPRTNTDPPATLTTDAAQAQQQLAATSPPAQTIVAAAQGPLALQPEAAACVATQLDANTELRDALGNQPQTSPRYNDLNTLAADCIRRTTGAANFANSIAAQATTQLSSAQLNCLRDGFATLTADQVGNIVNSGLEPNKADPSTKKTLDDLFDNCRIDRANLAQP